MTASAAAGPRSTGRVVFAVILGVIAIAFLVVGVIYLVTPEGSLPAWLGHSMALVGKKEVPARNHHTLRAAGCLITGVVFAIGAWFSVSYAGAAYRAAVLGQDASKPAGETGAEVTEVRLANGGSVRIACVGGGPAGLYFALLMKLCGPGNHVTVYERNQPGTGHGGGVSVDRKLLATMARFDSESAHQIGRAAVRWQDTVVSYRGERDVHHDNGVCYSVSRQRFADILAARAAQLGVSVRFEREVRSAAELRDADLVLAADGAGSTLRGTQAGFGSTVAEGRNKYAWLGTSKAFDGSNFIFERTDAGWIWAYACRYAPAASTFVVECAPETWDRLGFADGPASVGLDKIAEIFAAHLDGHPLSARLPGGTDTSWLSFQTVTNARWHLGRVVLAGDSAHTAHFSAGLGIALAIEDVIALAAQLRASACLMATGIGRGHGAAMSCLVPALDSYQQQRAPAIRRHAVDAGRSAAWFENMPRYAGLAPRPFAQAVRARRAPLLPALPPRIFSLLHRAKEIR